MRPAKPAKTRGRLSQRLATAGGNKGLQCAGGGGSGLTTTAISAAAGSVPTSETQRRVVNPPIPHGDAGKFSRAELSSPAFIITFAANRPNPAGRFHIWNLRSVRIGGKKAEKPSETPRFSKSSKSSPEINILDTFRTERTKNAGCFRLKVNKRVAKSHLDKQKQLSTNFQQPIRPRGGPGGPRGPAGLLPEAELKLQVRVREPEPAPPICTVGLAASRRITARVQSADRGG